MTAYNNDIMLSAAALEFNLEPCEAPDQTQALTYSGQPLKEGDVIEKFTINGPKWFRLVQKSSASTGRVAPNYHPQSGGNWKLGHRD